MASVSLLHRLKSQMQTDTRKILTTLIILIGLVVLATILSKGIFLQPRNLFNLIFQNVILGVVALGQLLVILTSGIDLSVGSIVGLSTVILMLYQYVGLLGALALTLGAATLLGLINGFFVAVRKLPAFVVTLAMMLFAYSLAQALSGGAGVYTGLNGAKLSPFIKNFNKQALSGIPYPAVVWIIALIGVSLFLRLSYGHFAYAVGGNENAAYLSGIPVRLVRMMIYGLSSLLAGLGGILSVARVGEGHPAAGQWYLLDSIAAVTIGGASLAGGGGSVIGTLMGVFILGAINNIMNLLNVSPMMQPAVKGAVILLAVYLNSRGERS